MKTGNLSDVVKILIFGAAVIITCIIVALGFQAAETAKEISDSALMQMTDLNNDIKDSDLKIYDGSKIYGSDVINCIKKNLGDYSLGETAPIYVYVKTSLTENTYTNSTYLSEIKSFSNTRYIKPTMVFAGTVVENTNNVIVGIRFIQE
jgi:hypothetical protein